MKRSVTKKTDIPKRVKEAVWERDSEQCVFCGSRFALPSCHFIPRSQGGLGVEENIVTLCGFYGNDCHRKMDLGDQVIRAAVRRYLQSVYPDWDEAKLVYHKNGGIECPAYMTTGVEG